MARKKKITKGVSPSPEKGNHPFLPVEGIRLQKGRRENHQLNRFPVPAAGEEKEMGK